MKNLGPVGCTLLLAMLGCGDSTEADPGPDVRMVDTTWWFPSSPKVLSVLVVDDRSTAAASLLRSGVGPAMRRLAQTAAAKSGADRPAWHPIDLRVLVVPASTAAIEAVKSPATDAPLAWTTVQATIEGADALATAVGERVMALAAPSPEAPFRPLERARDVVRLLTGARSPEDEGEARVAAIGSAHFWTIGVSVIAASDDQSPEPPTSYWVDGEGFDSYIVGGLVTPESRTSGTVDAARSPRLAAWAANHLETPIPGCYEGPETPFFLFPVSCIDIVPRCDGREIEQRSPGLGSCVIEVTTRDSSCASSRGWMDPVDADGVRRPRTSPRGDHVCEALPVDPESMDACVHDPQCEGCTSGWCITELYRTNNHCPAGSMPFPIRWVGGVLPDPGTVHVSCLEATVER